jgi:BCD family chlorophyll transporter-like MFS transporter
MFGSGVVLIGFGSAMFMAGTLSAAMGKAKDGATGLALGSWGAVQVLAVGSAIIFAASVKTVVSELAGHGLLGPTLANPVTGYAAVYVIEIVLLLATLIALIPLLRRSSGNSSSSLRPA